jgi:AcrR family transcriptional regulator
MAEMSSPQFETCVTDRVDGAMDPRIERTRAAVLDAATDLLVEGGPSALTMDAVVARSGVAKSTLYRHWPTRDALVASVFEHCAPDVPVPDADLPFHESLQAFVRGVAAILDDEQWRPMVPALLLLKAQHPEIAAIEQHLNEEQMGIVRPLLDRGRAEGHLRVELDDEVLAALLLGPVVMAALTLTSLDVDALADEAVRQFLAGAAPA